MKYLIPLLLFLSLFLTSGIYFSIIEAEYAFYQISPIVIIIPSIILGITLSKEKLSVSIEKFTDGMSDKRIISMIVIFLLSGAFTQVTKSIGGIDSIVNLTLSITSPKLIIPSIFVISAILGTAMGTSMGVIAAVTPIATEIAKQFPRYEAICIATVISGAMFGDNLSLISDTTIAAVKSQSALLIEKFKINSLISTIAAIVTIIVLTFFYNIETTLVPGEYSIIKIMPYFVVFFLALCQIHVFVVLLMGVLVAAIIGFIKIPAYNLVTCSQDIYTGFLSIHEVMLFSLLISGLIYLAKEKGIHSITTKLTSLRLNRRSAQYSIALLVSISDILTANNTIAILLTGDITKAISQKNKIKPHVSAFLLDTFSCVFQGIIPHGAQLILASSLSGIDPLAISPRVFFCYIMAIITTFYIALTKKECVEK